MEEPAEYNQPIKTPAAPVVGKVFTPEFEHDKKFDTERSELVPEQEDVFVPVPTKKVVKIKPLSVLVAIAFFFTLEILILTSFIYLLVPCAINIKVTFVNALCSAIFLAAIKKWWKDNRSENEHKD